MKINRLLQTLSCISAALIVSATLYACDSKHEKHSSSSHLKTHIVTVEKQPTVSHLYYSGSIQPLHTINVISPVSGVITKMLANYGDWVRINQAMLVIRSSKSQQDYATALTNYLKNKDQYLRDKNSFDATSALYKAGIVDRETYLRDRSQVETNRLAYLTAASTLHSLMQNTLKQDQDFSKLSLENMADFEDTLKKQYNEFTINAAINGILLAPQKNQSGADSNDKLLSEGAEVKENQILFSLGDMTGMKITIAVNETDISKISAGQMVILSSPALPGLIFQGKVTRVARQTSEIANQNVASFPVQIEIPTITETQRQLVRIGMSAKADIEIRQPPQLKVPIQAVFEKNGQDMVSIIDAKTGKAHDVVVETGGTDAMQVIIIKGLIEGQRVIVND